MGKGKNREGKGTLVKTDIPKPLNQACPLEVASIIIIIAIIIIAITIILVIIIAIITIIAIIITIRVEPVLLRWLASPPLVSDPSYLIQELLLLKKG